MNEEKLTTFIEENEAELYRIHKELCLIPAPSGFEDQRAEYCKKYLESVGAEGVYIDDMKNVVFPLNCENSDKITIFSAHTDTVFPMETKLDFIDDGEYLRCPGVGDDTGNLAVLLLSVKYLLKENFKPKNGVLFACNSCEEGLGNLKGTKKIFSDYDGRIARVVPIDTGLGRVISRCVGTHRYEVTVRTPGGHSLGAFGKPNAIEKAAGMIAKIYQISATEIPGTRITYNVGIIKGGTSINTIAPECTFLCEYRSDSVDGLALMKQKFEKIFTESETEDVSVTVKLIGERPCAKDVDQKELDRMIEVVAGVEEPILDREIKQTIGSTDCNIPLSMGIPAICIGAINSKGAHSLAETTEKKSLKTGLRVIPPIIEKMSELE